MSETNKKLRIFINSNAPWATSGYSGQVSELLPLIAKEGYPTAMCDFYGLEGGKLMLDGVLHYPKINHVYGSDAIVLHAQDFKADVVFTLQDQWVLHPNDLQQVNRYIPICPVDHDPIPNAVFEKLKYAYRIVSYSKFGQKELQRKGLMSTYIPHTVDTEVFKPLDKAERKKASGIPENAFLVGMVAANKDNPPRKSFQEVLDAFKMFLVKVPEALLYIHTNPDMPGGFPIKEYAGFIGIGDKLLFPDTYQMNFNTSKEQMNLVYNAMDVLVSPSFSEGFGVPIIEAQSCGVPAIVNNWTSMPELVKPGQTGEICDVASKRFTALGSYAGIPSVPSLYDKMMRIYKADRVKMGEKAREFVVDEYDTKKVFKEKWAPYLEKLEKEIYKDQT
jgi:glycosyltransferase involved in cell wall biosynthesis